MAYQTSPSYTLAPPEPGYVVDDPQNFNYAGWISGGDKQIINASKIGDNTYRLTRAHPSGDPHWTQQGAFTVGPDGKLVQQGGWGEQKDSPAGTNIAQGGLLAGLTFAGLGALGAGPLAGVFGSAPGAIGAGEAAGAGAAEFAPLSEAATGIDLSALGEAGAGGDFAALSGAAPELGAGEVALPTVTMSVPSVAAPSALGTAAAVGIPTAVAASSLGGPEADYSNEGRNYPTEQSTQGAGGSPVNASTTGGVPASALLSGASALDKLLSNPTVQNLIAYGTASGATNQSQALQNALKSVAIDSLTQLSAQLGHAAPPNFLQYINRLRDDLAQGKIEPAQAIASVQAQSALHGIQIPDNIAQVQSEALSRLGEVSRQGYTPIERAAIQRALDQITTQTQGQQQGIKQEFQERGQWGAGNELVQRLMAQQAGANQASQQGLDIAAAGQKRALDALTSQGQLAQLQAEQSLTTQKAVGSAQDQINALNAQLGTQVAQQNAARQQEAAIENQANTLKLGQAATQAAVYQQDALAKQRQQQLDTQNAAAKNAASMWGAPYKQQIAGTTASNNALSNIGRNATTATDLVKAGTQLYDAGSQAVDWLASLSDPREKENKRALTDEELDDVFTRLVPHSFTYTKEGREAGAPPGPVVGVMADQLERTPAKGVVVQLDVDGNPRKGLDPQKALSLALAALTGLHRRVNDLETD